MKTKLIRQTVLGIGVGAVMAGWAVLAQVTEVQVVQEPPLFGTFYSLQRTNDPPLPFNPFPELTLYTFGPGLYAVDDREVDFEAMAQQAEALRLLRQATAESLAAEGMSLMLLSSEPPSPPGGEGGGTNNPPASSPPVWQTSTQLCLIPSFSLSAGSVTLTFTNSTPGAPYDLYCTTNLSPTVAGLNLTNWLWLARSGPGQTNFIIVDPPWPEAYYALGTTNDSDGGGFPDAYERLVTHGSVTNTGDDLFPVVSIVASDSFASEQNLSNRTACFVVSRTGGWTNHALAVGLSLSGTASYVTDYTLTTVTTNPAPMGRAVVIPAGASSMEVFLTAENDSQTEGSETATVSVATNWPFYQVSSGQGSATAWMVEEYQNTYTSTADFTLGTRMGLTAANNQLQFKTDLPAQFPFINVACSDRDPPIAGRGTVARINTTNGQVVGEYRTAPAGIRPDPSRTTVDQYGNVWVANRADSLAIKGRNYGSITRIGLIIGGTRYRKNPDGSFSTDATGEYVSVTNATYNTCLDRDGDGYIRTSRGLADLLAWSNPGGVDSAGGVSSAEDEAILNYTRVPCTGTRTIAVDRFNDAWVGGYASPQTHLLISGLTGDVVPESVFDAGCGGYGGVVDCNGVLWPSRKEWGDQLRLVPPAVLPPTPADWSVLTANLPAYGIAVDPLHPYIWQTADANVFRWHLDGTLVTNAQGVILNPHGDGRA